MRYIDKSFKAPKELQAGWKMMKMAKEEIQWPQWLAKNVPQGGRVGINPFLMNSGIDIIALKMQIV